MRPACSPAVGARILPAAKGLAANHRTGGCACLPIHIYYSGFDAFQEFLDFFLSAAEYPRSQPIVGVICKPDHVVKLFIVGQAYDRHKHLFLEKPVFFWKACDNRWLNVIAVL